MNEQTLWSLAFTFGPLLVLAFFVLAFRWMRKNRERF